MQAYWNRVTNKYLILELCCYFRLVTSDLAFFKESLKNLSGLGDISKSLDDLWRTVNELRMNRGSPSTGKKNILQR